MRVGDRAGRQPSARADRLPAVRQHVDPAALLRLAPQRTPINTPVGDAHAGLGCRLPKDGKVLTFGVKHPKPRTVATGGRLLVDLEFGRHGALYALAQGVWPAGGQEGSPAAPNTGQLLRVNHGRFSVVARGLDRPTSLEIVGSTAYIVTLTGEVWTVDLGKRHRRS